ncbi:hypothetical protein ACP4OV_019712 [Aristida adscensionis]
MFSNPAYPSPSPCCCHPGTLVAAALPSAPQRPSHSSPGCRMPQLEPPFRPREKLLELQRYFQNVQKHTYLKGRYDAVTSVGIPLALAASSLFLIGRGVYNMSHGIGKKE